MTEGSPERVVGHRREDTGPFASSEGLEGALGGVVLQAGRYATVCEQRGPQGCGRAGADRLLAGLREAVREQRGPRGCGRAGVVPLAGIWGAVCVQWGSRRC